MSRFTWNETKRRENIRKHGIDFTDIPAVFSVVLIAHSETTNAIRIIHARKASKATAKVYFERFRD